MCDSLLKRLGLEKYRNTKAGRLSGGEQQRVAIARAIVNRPTVLIADDLLVTLILILVRILLNCLSILTISALPLLWLPIIWILFTYLNKRVIELKDGRVLSDNMRGAEFNEA